jgi:hypothetical protein
MSMLILGQKTYYLGPTISKIPQLNCSCWTDTNLHSPMLSRYFFQTQISALCPCDLLRPQFSHFRLWIFFNFPWVWFLCLFELGIYGSNHDNFGHISIQKKEYDRSHLSPWLLVHKKPGPQEIWFQNKIHFTAFNAGTKFLGTKFLGDQISQGPKQPRKLRSKWDRGPFQLLLQKEFHTNANLVQQPGESQQFKVAFTAGNCGWLWSKPLMRIVRTSRRHLLAEKELSMVLSPFYYKTGSIRCSSLHFSDRTVRLIEIFGKNSNQVV